MYLARVGLAALVATGGVSAWGTSDAPPKPSIVSQANQCGNGVTPYCCNNEAKYGGDADCTAMGQSSICDTTVVCCNANDVGIPSIQRCVGDIAIEQTGGPAAGTSGAPATTKDHTTPTSASGPAASVVSQVNQCGNGVTPYCCNNEAFHGGEANCNSIDQSSICDTTIVCCNAYNSIQVCIGDIIIQSPPSIPSPTGASTTTPGTPGTPSITTTPTKTNGDTTPSVPSTTTTSEPIASVVTQSNQCGNNITPYCCNNEAIHGGEANCTSMDQSSICDTTIVCCNAHNSIQVCIGDIIIQKPTVTVTPPCTGIETVTVTDTVTDGVTDTVTDTVTDGVTDTVTDTVTDEVTDTVTTTVYSSNVITKTITIPSKVPVPTTIKVPTTIDGVPTTVEVPTTIRVPTKVPVPVTSTITRVETTTVPTTVKVPTTIKGVPTTVEVPTTTVVTTTVTIPTTVTESPGQVGPVQQTTPTPPVETSTQAEPSAPLFTGAAVGSGSFDGSAVAGVLAVVALLHIHL